MCKKDPTAISMFCGAGGCSLGFKKAGYDIIFASDINKRALDTYKRNFPYSKTSKSDINEIDFSTLIKELDIKPGELDFLIGGPPCQGFSTAGLRFWDDPRNSLLKSYVNALDKLKPKWFLMENVEGLLTANDGLYLFELTKSFVDLGYYTRVEKVYAQEYGIPQRRKRVFIIGNRLNINFEWPEPIMFVKGKIFRNSENTLRNTISDLPKPTHDINSYCMYINKPESEWEEQLRNGASVITDHFSPIQSGIQLERIRNLKQGQSMKDLPVGLQHLSFQKRSKRRVKDGTPSKHRGGPPSGLKRLVFDEPCLTITGASNREFIHPEQNRPLTIRECARIQTFPDSFLFEGNNSEKIKQIGNAIPPLLARFFAEYIKDNYGFHEINSSKGKLIGFSLTKAKGMSHALQNSKKLLEKIMYNEIQPELFKKENNG